MIFSNKYNFGVTEKIFLNEFSIGYLNLCKVKTSIGYTACDATSLDKNSKVAIKKCYSEYLERFSMGIPIDRDIKTEVVELVNKNVKNNLLSEFGYGDHLFGHNDTTGTAAGTDSKSIIEKAICELIEKNEVFCFWYGRSGKVLEINHHMRKMIDKLGFISTEFYCFLLNEISNFPTIIVLGFDNGRLITTGVSCSNNMMKSLCGAFQEARIIEWQQYNNIKSNFTNYSVIEQELFLNAIKEKKNYLEKGKIVKNKEEQIKLVNWVHNIQVRLLYSDNILGIKVVKCISENLFSSLPITKNISKSLRKEIVKRYYIDKEVDCPIV